MHIVHPDVEKYIDSLTADNDPVLAEMETLAREKNFPIVGPQVGRLLYFFAKTSGAKKIMELGSGYGYSAWWFAKALPADGNVICTDTDPDNERKAIDFLTRAGLKSKVDFVLGSALDVLEQQQGTFDIIFNDIDKEDYPESIDRAVAKLRSGGLFITDNALWYGKVALEEEPDKTTRGVLDFNEGIARHPQLESMILPLRDGLAVAMKK